MVPKPVIAVVMCYPVAKESDALAKQEDEEQAAKGVTIDPELFYMKQTIGNACGTIAVLHSIGNNLNTLAPADGSFLKEFFGSTSGMSAAEAGKYLEDPPQGAPSIEAAHQEAAAEGDTAPPSADDEVDLHFVALVHVNGQLWELDGRRAGPVCRGATSEESLLSDAARVAQEFISRSNSLTFNVLALTATPDEDEDA
ncbi:hypothetical protein PLESTB_000452000 [Pleodorina starrii]|uniref:Ubiquitin carboxyl-terminal hydrolase n=1 Tax=Pleodorina starrii TaxID=330485 RepID=A0A9W6EZT6_9CHLO|nr:hypothetical protein PLESTB_000452000 [Pleodorina starrii]